MEFLNGNKTLISFQANEHALHIKLMSADRLLTCVLIEYRNVTEYKTGNVRIIEARSCNHCCCGKAIIMAYSECEESRPFQVRPPGTGFPEM